MSVALTDTAVPRVPGALIRLVHSLVRAIRAILDPVPLALISTSVF